jgi:hypothetical protein
VLSSSSIFFYFFIARISVAMLTAFNIPWYFLLSYNQKCANIIITSFTTHFVNFHNKTS